MCDDVCEWFQGDEVIEGQSFVTIAVVARKHEIKRTTLSRRWESVTTTRDQAAEDKRFLNNQRVQQIILNCAQVQRLLCRPTTSHYHDHERRMIHRDKRYECLDIR